MKRLGVSWGIVLFLCGALTARAVDSDLPSVQHRVLKYCDPVCELQSQDSAFSLLLEVFRQNKAHRIQTQYESRLSAATTMSAEHGSLLIQTDSQGLRTLRAWVLELAEKERDLSMKQLQQDVDNFRVAYGCARRLDEQEVGEPVPSKVDTDTAAAVLPQFSIIALGDTGRNGVRLVRSAPADTVLIDAAPTEAAGPHIEPCE